MQSAKEIKDAKMKKDAKVKDAKEYQLVFQRYLEICNQAIDQNKKKFPYTEIWGARLQAKAKEEAMKIHAVVFDDRPKVSFELQLTEDMKIKILEMKEVPPEDAWPFTYQYLKRVVDNPKEYIENPARLEWGWLKTIFAQP